MKIFRRGGGSSSSSFSPKAVVPLGNIGTVARPVQQKDLDDTLKKINAEVGAWDGSRIVLVKPLQDAARNHGQVQLMKDTADGKNLLMAVKRMPNRWMCMGSDDFDQKYPTASEKPWHDIGYIRHLASSGFPYVCDLHGVFRSDDETFVATSFCPDGDLFGWCDLDTLPPSGAEREEHMRPIVAQIFSGVRWLHDLGIAHRDLSLENILLIGSGADAKVKIIDFGMATLRRTVKDEVRGKNSYQAPELHHGGEVDTFLADGFSLGVTVFAMAVQDYPWTCTRRGKCQLFEYVTSNGFRKFLNKRRLRKGNGQYLNDVLTPAMVEMLEALLQFDPKQRGSIGEVAFQPDVKKKKRKSVFDMPYLRDAADVPGTSAEKEVKK